MSESSENKEKSKPVIGLSQLRSLVGKLPNPVSTLENTYVINYGENNTQQLEFEKIIIKKNNEKVVRWSFKGRFFIESKYIGKSEK